MDDASSQPTDPSPPPPVIESAEPPSPASRPLSVPIKGRTILLIALALVAAWAGLQAYRGRQQARSAAAVRALGGKVVYAHEMLHAGQPWAPKWLRDQLGDDLFVSVTRVDLSRTQVSDDDLACLAGLPNLQVLHLAETGVGDAGVKHLAGLTRLEELSLKGTGITDAGLVSLRRCSRLHFLYLEGTRISDAGIAKLERLSELKAISLPSGVTADGASQLLTALPTVYVVRRP